MDHLERTRAEFARQADNFAASAAISDQGQVARLVSAAGALAGRRVLDVACGPGIVTRALAHQAREVVAFDLTPKMLEKAKERCAAAGLSNVAFKEGSATALPFKDGEFDVVVTRLSFHHFSEPSAALSEMLRVLRPGGTIVVADVVSSENPAKSELQNAIEVLRDPSHVRMLPASELLSLLSRDDLTIIAEESWEKPREFEEWLGIVASPERAAPLRTIVRSFATAGEDAGMGLRISDGVIRFFHRWLLLAARKS
ncbi:MAG: class I SAM-dependent methyltransferase [Hyphomicrobiaceae bacterium]